MTVHNGKYSARAEHRRHDRLLVTRFAMDDAYPGERDEAHTLVETCAECAALAADVRLLASSMSRLPAPARPRDFTITQDQADQLRGSRLRQWLRSLATPRLATLRPVAGVALSIGLVMAVVGSALPSYAPAAGVVTDEPGVETPTKAFPAARSPEAALPQPAATEALVPEIAAPAGATDGDAAAEGEAPHRPGAAPLSQASQEPETRALDQVYLEESPSSDVSAESAARQQFAPADPTRDALIYGGLVIAALSLALLVLAWTLRRYFTDPLLR